MVQPTEQVPIFFFGIDFSLGCRIVEFELLHGVFDRTDLFGEEVFEVGPFVAFGFAFGNAGSDARVFGELFPMFLEIGIVPFYCLCVLILDLGSEEVIVVRPKYREEISTSGQTRRQAKASTDHP